MKRLLPSALLVLAICSTSAAAAPVTITVAQPWGAGRTAAFAKIGAAFEASHPDIKVEWRTISNDAVGSGGSPALFTEVAAGTPPDVTFVDGTQVAPWVINHVLTPLDPWLQKDGVSSADFFLGGWRQAEYRGQVWALPSQTNVLPVLIWNKQLFSEAGLPDTAPTDIQTLDAYNRSLVKRSADGKLTQFGLVPWAIYGNANSLVSWGFIFGGQFFDDEQQRFTVNDERVLAALQWWKSGYADRYGAPALNALGGINGFWAGNLAMEQDVPNFALAKMPPDWTSKYGVTPYNPYPAGGAKGMIWAGGWMIAMPKGAPHADAAWEFIRWYSADPAGTAVVYDELGDLTGYKHSDAFAAFHGDPLHRSILNMLDLATFYRPVTPVTDKFMGQLDSLVNEVLSGKQTPKAALDEANRVLNQQLSEVLK